MTDPITFPAGIEEFCGELRAAGLDAPWSRPGPLIQPKATKVQPRLWRDALDSPIVRYLENLLMQPFPDDRQKGAVGISEKKFTAPGLRPAWRAPDTPHHHHHLIHYRWESTEAALQRLAGIDQQSPY